MGHSSTIPPNSQFGYFKNNTNVEYLHGMIYLDTFEFEKLSFSENGHYFEIYIEVKKFDDKEIVLTLSHNRHDNARIANISIDKFKFIAIGQEIKNGFKAKY